ncbi:MAG: hypothetical protein IJS38_00230 [Erysipelotrichaceae bacterium]|nr:hypothetical protein [Erysipelotrichaceae bacterium]
MKEYYVNNIVDISDPDCLFIKEFNREIRKYGAIVYNHEFNSYQFIKKFSDIDYKKELLPDFLKIEHSNPLLKTLDFTIHYEFDPETEEDEENLEIWKELSEVELPVFSYDDDGEFRVSSTIRLAPTVSRHTVWFLKKESHDYILDTDLLLLTPIIKNLQIAQKLIREYSVNPLEADYDPDDLNSWQEPDFNSVRRKKSDQ